MTKRPRDTRAWAAASLYLPSFDAYNKMVELSRERPCHERG